MMNKCPDETLLVEYASGALSTAPSIAVTTHLKFCDKCANAVRTLGFIGGSLLECLEEEEVSAGLLGKVFDRIDSQEEGEPAFAELPKKSPSPPKDSVASGLPEFVRKLLPGEELRWRNLTSSLEVAPIRIGEESFELSLHKIQPGGMAPEHDHRGKEITVVLRGSFSDEDGVYHPGDFLVREEGDTHRPYAARNEECVCLSVLEAPIKLTGIKRILNPFISFSPS